MLLVGVSVNIILSEKEKKIGRKRIYLEVEIYRFTSLTFNIFNFYSIFS